MKNIYILICSISVFSITMISCNDDDLKETPTLNGSYTGTFTVEYSNGTIFSNPVTVNFLENNNYNCSSSPNYIPAGGSGTYDINSSTITFSDINLWTANFDGNLILNGTYNYTINGTELLISANKNDVGFYSYNLLKD